MSSNAVPHAPDDAIVIKKARVHNLKNIDVAIPRDRFVVITGPSGSGKSSLAFDTIYAEGQRRYVESLSAYARQFLEQIAKPDVDSISGLSPTISIEQRTTSYNPRSTVGTVTEIYDYLRLLYSRISKPFCWKCGKPIQSQTPQQIVDQILSYPDHTKLSILAPIVRERKGEHQKEFYQLRQRGFVRVRINGEVFDLSEEIHLDKNKKHSIEVFIDRIIIKPDRTQLDSRVSDSVELALKMGEGMLLLAVYEGSQAQEILFSQHFACSTCNISYPEPEPRTFSFNSPMGACPSCDGIGALQDVPAEDTDSDETTIDNLPIPDQKKTCPSCNGSRLKKESLHFKIENKNIAELCALPMLSLERFFQKLPLSAREKTITSRVLKEIQERLQFLIRVGVSYLSLDRSAQTLSGGEAQRIRLATQIGSSLVGVIYVLDEPSIGLHPRDHAKLLETLIQLRDLGNSVLVVEHDKETIEKADWILDLGPGAGVEGGKIVGQGTLSQIKKSKESLTGKYFNKTLTIAVPSPRKAPQKDHWIKVEGATQNNLKSVDAQFPLGVLTCVTGVSGSGKSTLVLDTLYRLLLKSVYKIDTGPVMIQSCTGLDKINKVVDIDQSPIGKTPRSNPATYTGIFGFIRDLYAQIPEAQIRGYKPGRFSFNVKGGRCETCEGDGVTKIEMHFLPDVYVQCDACKGKRYNRETLEIRYKGKNIAEVLDMDVSEAYRFFDSIPHLRARLTVLNQVGLGYIKLGQSATTLSGGEAQRIKLSKELSKRATGQTVYILDEPSTGLHFDDVNKLIKILQALVEQGNTVIVIEHNLDIIKVADHVIDLGPEGGEAGGEIVAAGTPEELLRNPKSVTGRFLKEYL